MPSPDQVEYQEGEGQVCWESRRGVTFGGIVGVGRHETWLRLVEVYQGSDATLALLAFLPPEGDQNVMVHVASL